MTETRRRLAVDQGQCLAAGMRGGKSEGKRNTVSNQALADGETTTMGAVTQRSASYESAQRGESPRAPRTSNAVCAWCGRELPNVEGIAAGEVTHGICHECFEREMAKIEEGSDEE